MRAAETLYSVRRCGDESPYPWAWFDNLSQAERYARGWCEPYYGQPHEVVLWRTGWNQ